jgi:16S rRNA G966 N2-methylase RsmD
MHIISCFHTVSVEQVYLDPPFNFQWDDKVVLKEKRGEASPAQIEAFPTPRQWG